jgi:hypothetical protein
MRARFRRGSAALIAAGLALSGARTAVAEGEAAVAAAADAAASAGPAAAGAAGAEKTSLAQLAALAGEVLEKMRRERVRPVPVAVKWSPRRIATLDVGGALGAMLGADLDGDQVPELYAVTDQAVIVYAISDAKVRELTRLPFAGEAAAIRPRDPVATLAVDVAAGELMAGSSSYARSLRLGWQGGQLVVREELTGLPLCAHQRGQLAVGRNYFVEVARRAEGPRPESRDGRDDGEASKLAMAQWRSKEGNKDHGKEAGFYGQRCREEVRLADGTRARAVARLPVEGALRVAVLPRAEKPGPARNHDVPGVGVAFDVGDVDRDGRVDVAYAGAGAPGDPDAVRVVPVSDPRQTLFRRAFTGGVAAVAMVDLDGDGAHEVIAAVRLPGSPRVDLWRLN